MSIELTREQSAALADESETPVSVFDPQSRAVYRLVPNDVYERIQRTMSQDSPWTAEEMAVLAGEAFSKLDDSDYSHYLSDSK